MASRYNLETLELAARNPSVVLDEVQRLISPPFHRAYDGWFRRTYGEGIDVVDRDWDNLLLLDACRYAEFESQNPIDGDLERVVSKGANSWAFMTGNFVGERLHDTVYVTANPHARKLDPDTFHAIETVLDRWDDERGTVQPAEVVRAAIDANERYPEKRLIVHFMQPHRPYLGPTAEKLRGRVDLIGYNRDRGLDEQSYERDGVRMWAAVERREVSRAQLYRAYQETLAIVLEHTQKLVDELDGKSVVSTDHGEMLGERVFPFTARLYGHSDGVDTPELRLVPWLEIDADRRRTITADEPVETDRTDESVVSDRLRALGYAE